MHRTKIHLLLLLMIATASLSSHAQVISGRENSEMTPKAAEATKLSGGGFVGDVNVITGEFSNHMHRDINNCILPLSF